MLKLFLTGASGFIGTHFINHVLRDLPDLAPCNLDLSPPKVASHFSFWLKGDILDKDSVNKAVLAFKPTHVVHFAARTDVEGKTLEEYRVNTEGTQNLIRALESVGSVERAIFTSSQYVVGPGPLSGSPWEHRPHTVYGLSKCEMEDIIRNSELPFIWTIVRPTNIWGPWHPRYPNEIWRVIKRGYYFHPGGEKVVRAYGYVGNVVDQMWKLMQADPALVNRKPFYVGDPVEDILKWTTAFSLAITNKPPRIIPRAILKMMARLGDSVKAIGAPFPLFSSRYRSMTESYLVDMEPTYEIVGEPKLSVNEGVQETISWLRTQGHPWTEPDEPKG